MLTHAWHEATWACCARPGYSLLTAVLTTHYSLLTTHCCCARPGGLVVDVGGNFGWYTLFSLALGCEVIVFEPVPLFQEVRDTHG